ncbi:MAG: hypothetical protein ABIF77_00905 [bacterium]
MKDCLAIIPACHNLAAGSDYLADLGGRPVLYHTLATARDAALDRIVVLSAEGEVLNMCNRWEAESIRLPVQLVGSEVPVEWVAAYGLNSLAAKGYVPQQVMLLSPELPLRRPGRLEAAQAAFERESADSLFSCSCEMPHFWRQSPGGLIPFYDPRERTIRSGGVSEPEWHRENGSIYLCRRGGLLRHGNRLFGKITMLEMDPEESLLAVGSAGLAVCRVLLDHVNPVAGQEWGDQTGRCATT